MAANDREERRRMRLRGAGTTGIAGASFGFTFGAPSLPSQSSSRQTPRAAAPRPSTKSTPVANSLPAQRLTPNTKPLPIRASTRRTSTASPPRVSTRRATRSRSASAGVSQHRSSSAQLSASRRSRTPAQQDGQLSIARSITGKRKRNEAISATLQESHQDGLDQHDEEDRAPSGTSHHESVRRLATPRVATPKPVAEEAEDELEQNDENHALSSEKKKGRRSSGRAGEDFAADNTPSFMQKRSSRSRKSLDGAGAGASSTSVKKAQAKGNVALEKKSYRSRKSDASIQKQATQVVEPTSSVETHRRRLSLRKPAVSTEEEGLVEEAETSVVSEMTTKPRRGRPSKVGMEQEPQEQDDLSTSLPRKSRRKSRGEKQALASASAVSEEEAEVSAAEDSPEDSDTETSTVNGTIRPPVSKPAVPNSKPRKRQTTSGEPKRKHQKLVDDARIPVTVFRLSKQQIFAEDEDELDQPAPIRLPTVNAIDVLAQISAEMTARMSTSLSNQAAGEPDKARRAELKRRAKTIDAFSVELSDRLFNLTEAVDTGEALKGRLKSVLKEKMALREEFLRIRKRRDETALQMDEVRKKHMEDEEKRRDEEQLNDALFDIELAVQRGREKADKEGRQDEGPEVGIEWDLREVADMASSSRGSNGLLNKVKHFNGFMEKAASVLEGRS